MAGAEIMAGGTPATDRMLRTQGRQTLARLLEAGTTVLTAKGYHAARVDDIVRAAQMSHGTFYLYFANKEELFRELARGCVTEMTALAGDLPAALPGAEGRADLREWLARFLDGYARYGMVIRGWMEDQVAQRELRRLGVESFEAMIAGLQERIGDRAGVDDRLAAVALLALIERSAYLVSTRPLDVDREVVLDTLATLVHQGFFGG